MLMANKGKEHDTAVYFYCFGIESILQDVLNKVKVNPSLTTHLQYNLMMLLCFILSLS